MSCVDIELLPTRPESRRWGAVASLLIHALATLLLLFISGLPARDRTHERTEDRDLSGHRYSAGHGAEANRERVLYVRLPQRSVGRTRMLDAVVQIRVRAQFVVATPGLLAAVTPIPADSAPTGAPSVGRGRNGAEGNGAGLSGAGDALRGVDTLAIPVMIVDPTRRGDYPAVPVARFQPPRPIPTTVLGQQLAVDFQLDASGRAVSHKFQPTPDGDLNTALDSIFTQMLFRPGRGPDGTPVAMVVRLTIDLW